MVPLQEHEKGSQEILVAIQNALFTNTGLLVGRFGTIEFETCWSSGPYCDYAPVLERNAGVFPSSTESIRKWVSATKEAFQNSDILATGWYSPIVKREQVLLNAWNVNASQIILRGIEPYYSSHHLRWTNALDGQKVCVVSAFTRSMASQIKKGEATIWPRAEASIWPPNVQWSWVNTGYAPSMSIGRAAWENNPSSWEEAISYVVSSVIASNADIVLIGCGGLGMIIANELKRRGKICIVMGGAIQVLFGIKGGRWKNHDFISKLWNEEWVYPSVEETPGCATTVENSCYWTS